MRRVLSHLLIAVITLIGWAPLNAETHGALSIRRGNDLNDYINEHPSFTAFKAYAHDLNDRDYYASINIDKKSNDINYNCHNKFSSINDIFVSNTSFTIATLTLSRLTGHLGPQKIYDEMPIVYIGENFDADSKKPSDGKCFFHFYRLHSPFVRHEGGDQKNDFSLLFKIRTAQNINPEIVGGIADSFLTISGLLDWTHVASGSFEKLAQATKEFQNYISSMFSSDKSSEQEWPLLSQDQTDLIYDIIMPGVRRPKGRSCDLR